MSNGTSNGNGLGPVPPLPQPQLTDISPGVSLLEPLSRKGNGPGLIVLVPTQEKETEADRLAIKDGVPSTLVKWAEEGYTVIEIKEQAFNASKDPFVVALDALQKCAKCEPKDKVGLIACDTNLWGLAAPFLPSHSSVVGVVLYAAMDDVLSTARIPMLQHLAGKASSPLTRSPEFTAYEYPSVKHNFATPFHPSFHYSTESVSHTRNLSFLKPLMGGPYFDLEAIWDEHTYFEFEVRSVEHTMATMVQEPYVNHIPTMTGGIGRERLTDFYRNHFIFNNPDDTALELISRTVGIDRVIDEFIFKFTHDKMVDWLLPGVPPTGKYVEIPFTGVVNIRGDRLYHEHIAWDQTSVLRQLGLLPEYLSWPYATPDGASITPGKTLEYQVPTAGSETASKMRDKNSVESNEMFIYELRQV